MCEEQIAYMTETPSKFTTVTITTESGEKYWTIGDLEMFESLWIDIRDFSNNPNIELYVLPNTQLVYKVEYFFEGFRHSLYSIYGFNFEILTLCLFEFVLILMLMKFRKNA